MVTENKYAQFWIEEGILYFVYKPGTILTLKAAEQVLEDRLFLQNERSYPILCDLRLIRMADKQARDFLAQQGSILAIAVALLVEKPYSEKLGEVFMKTSKPVVPTEEFTSRSRAIEFLKQFN